MPPKIIKLMRVNTPKLNKILYCILFMACYLVYIKTVIHNELSAILRALEPYSYVFEVVKENQKMHMNLGESLYAQERFLIVQIFLLTVFPPVFMVMARIHSTDPLSTGIVTIIIGHIVSTFWPPDVRII